MINIADCGCAMGRWRYQQLIIGSPTRYHVYTFSLLWSPSLRKNALFSSSQCQCDHHLLCLHSHGFSASWRRTPSDTQGATALLRQKSARGFANVCVRSTQSKHLRTVIVSDHQVRAMKLSRFANRHLYVLSDRFSRPHTAPQLSSRALA